MRVAVVGAGAWGSAFAEVMRQRGHDVTLAGRDAPEHEEVAACELLCVAVPSKVFREVIAALPGSAPVLILTKGLDPASGKRLSRVVPRPDVLMLSGPNHAEEIAQGLPAAAVYALLTVGERVEVKGGPQGARFLLIAGRPLNEPVVQYGPFVMNTRQEIEQAIRDYQTGELTKAA